MMEAEAAKIEAERKALEEAAERERAQAVAEEEARKAQAVVEEEARRVQAVAEVEARNAQAAALAAAAVGEVAGNDEEEEEEIGEMDMGEGANTFTNARDRSDSLENLLLYGDLDGKPEEIVRHLKEMNVKGDDEEEEEEL